MNEKAFIEWSYVDHWVASIACEIEKKDIKYDTIVALGRGGLIPGAMLSYKLNIKNLQNIGINTRHEDGEYLETLIYQKPSAITGNVLVVDDINDSGKTFESINSLIKTEYPDTDELMYCSLVKRNTSIFKERTIEAIQTKLDDWFVFPWDK
jgi:hypoxanthine phosphoribosyltransferase